MLPTLFISHGSPMHAVDASRAAAGWADLGRNLPRPKAILVASAHWESEWPMLTTSRRPETIHDFGGFPAALYELRYPAAGDPQLAARAIELIRAAGIAANGNGCRGLDHGAWVPLRHMLPQADVPVVQISLQPRLGAAHHLRLGEALAPLRDEGVLIVGSGHLTHNLREWIASARANGTKPVDAGVEPYVQEFAGWVDRALREDDREALCRWRESAPHALRAHPTDEHFLPLPFAFGAAGTRPRIERLDLGVDSRVLAMDAYVFWPGSRGETARTVAGC
jgi:4,5-DOPA dioxygenase extradiol